MCGAAACSKTKCIRGVDRRVNCKTVSRAKTAAEAREKLAAGYRPKHRWVNGNLPLDSLCSVCEEPAGDGPGLRDFRCIWCQRTVHRDCQQEEEVTTAALCTDLHFSDNQFLVFQ